MQQPFLLSHANINAFSEAMPLTSVQRFVASAIRASAHWIRVDRQIDGHRLHMPLQQHDPALKPGISKGR